MSPEKINKIFDLNKKFNPVELPENHIYRIWGRDAIKNGWKYEKLEGYFNAFYLTSKSFRAFINLNQWNPQLILWRLNDGLFIPEPETFDITVIEQLQKHCYECRCQLVDGLYQEKNQRFLCHNCIDNYSLITI